jgi:hypothetical protein
MDTFLSGQRRNVRRCASIDHDDVGTDAKRPAAAFIEIGKVGIRLKEQRASMPLAVAPSALAAGEVEYND